MLMMVVTLYAFAANVDKENFTKTTNRCTTCRCSCYCEGDFLLR